ncbi:hypothetical protein DWW76_12665 [Coprobacillus sp. AF17-11AC]|nr:hypothetical protein DWW80_11585 [Coprobacillus sp. AF17-17AC]RGG83487.1 hypothetical protein DWW76_12665 [Coprobacillus sp. AF17-11AC]
MLLAVKGNKEVAIEEKDAQSYLSDGYDIYESKDGKVSLKNTSPSKKVIYSEYEKVVNESKKLAEELKKAKEEIKKLKEAAGK